MLVHGHAAVEGLATWRLAARAGLPYVLTFHGSDINTWPAAHPDRLDDLRAAARGAAAVIAVSGALAERVRVLTGVDAQALPLGCDHRALSAQRLERGEARRLLALPEDAVVALFVGHLLPAKGVHEFVDGVLAAGPPVLGVLVGGGRERGYGLGDTRGATSLRYTGELPHEQVVHYMSAADVVVLPSYGEGMPTVLVEAGSLGLPVIATAVGGVPELLGTDRGTILPRADARGVADALRAFAAEPAAAAAAATRLQRHVLAEYDVDTNAARLLACYRAAGARLSGG
jgi:teichuronic acid biosynthesis glycosyltransferase TuaC